MEVLESMGYILYLESMNIWYPSYVSYVPGECVLVSLCFRLRTSSHLQCQDDTTEN
jgi:hypothetical protein